MRHYTIKSLFRQLPDFYALRCVEALGMDPDDGVVRVSI